MSRQKVGAVCRDICCRIVIVFTLSTLWLGLSGDAFASEPIIENNDTESAGESTEEDNYEEEEEEPDCD